MSLNKMLHSDEDTEYSDGSKKRIGKVKVFYSFKDSDVTCLCSFELPILTPTENERWIPISLKQCLLSVCLSCPDKLMRGVDYDMAIYTANIEESNIDQQQSLRDVRATVIWEGHGLLSNLLQDQNNSNIMVTGQLSKAIDEPFDFNIQVLLQLHPIRRSQPVESPSSQQQHTSTQSHQHTLPPMKSLLTPDHHQVYSTYPSSSSSASPPYQSSFEQQKLISSNSNKLPLFRPFGTHQPPLRSELDFIPPLSSSSYQSTAQRPENPDWQKRSSSSSQPYDDQHKRRKLSPPLPTSSTHHQPLNQHPHRYDSPPPPHLRSDTPMPSSTPPPPSTTFAGALTTGSSSSSSAKSTTRKTPVDTFYHQSRRKKRDTKPPNASDIRPYIEVDRDPNGRYILPVEVDSWTVVDLGTVVYDRAAFHNQRYLYPVGYCVKKWYRSMVDPHSDTQYTCQILDGGDEPIFQLEADDNPGEVWRGPTPTTVWTIAVRRAFKIRQMDYGHNPVGPDFFGLRKNTIAKMIQDLPNADKCKNYIWQNFEPITTTGTKNKAMRRSNTRIGSTVNLESTPPTAAESQSADSPHSPSTNDGKTTSSPPL
ncbi:hypothetical protein BC941DRAFT_420485 [Chlamydoabsidia padenii]|nr:hypothetical protein BC941DRAFT_420485 [Chlamydoabsidia padenii]